MSFRLLFGAAAFAFFADRVAVPTARDTLFAVDWGKRHLVATIASGKSRRRSGFFLTREVSRLAVGRPIRDSPREGRVRTLDFP